MMKTVRQVDCGWNTMSNTRSTNRRIDRSGKEPEELSYYEMIFDPIKTEGSKFEIWKDTLRYKWQVFDHKSNWLTWGRDETVRGWIIDDYYEREERLLDERLQWTDSTECERR